jgi:hypothetical protein
VAGFIQGGRLELWDVQDGRKGAWIVCISKLQLTTTMKVNGMIISPTGKGIRNDGAGSGLYHASRGDRLHQGVDFLCEPGQNVVCPINNAKVVRHAYPYSDLSYGGLLLRNYWFEILLFYLTPRDDIFERVWFQGEVLGTAQDITARYGGDMLPHIHLQIDSCDPLLFARNYGDKAW